MLATAADLITVRRSDIDPDPQMAQHMTERVANVGMKEALKLRDGGR